MVYITLVDFKLRSKYTQVIVWRNNRCKSRRWQNDITINQQQPQIYTNVSFYMAYFIDLILSLLELASLWNIHSTATQVTELLHTYGSDTHSTGAVALHVCLSVN